MPCGFPTSSRDSSSRRSSLADTLLHRRNGSRHQSQEATGASVDGNAGEQQGSSQHTGQESAPVRETQATRRPETKQSAADPPPYRSDSGSKSKAESGGIVTSTTETAQGDLNHNSLPGTSAGSVWQKIKSVGKETEEEKRQRKEDYERLGLKHKTTYGHPGSGNFHC